MSSPFSGRRPAPLMRRSEGRIHSAPAIHEIPAGPRSALGRCGREDVLRAARTLVEDYAAGLEETGA